MLRPDSYRLPFTLMTHGNVVTLRCIEILQKVGEGGFGEVYKVKDLNSGEVYALKISTVHSRCDLNIVLREAEILKMLRHPNIVKMIGVDKYGCNSPIRRGFRPLYAMRSLLLKMEYCKRSLKDAIQKQETQDVNFRLTTIKQVIEGLYYLHTQNITHRDIKPDNILLDENNVVKLCDFGLAKEHFQGIPNKFTASDNYTCAKGTLWYLAPEILNSAANIPVEWLEKADVYSTGKTWLVMCTSYNVPSEIFNSILEDFQKAYYSNKATFYMIGGEQVILSLMLRVDVNQRISIPELHAQVTVKHLSICQSAYDARNYPPQHTMFLPSLEF